jgi:hypothetical protein
MSEGTRAWALTRLTDLTDSKVLDHVFYEYVHVTRN